LGYSKRLRMSPHEVAERVADRMHIPKSEARDFLWALADVIAEGLSNGRTVAIEDVGMFSIVLIPARRAWNIHEKRMRIVQPYMRFKFVPSKNVLNAVKDLNKRLKPLDIHEKFGLKLEEDNMEKYGVVIDPERVQKEKRGQAGNVDDHPDTNVPIHPKKGTKPYEKRPTKEEKK